MGAILDGPKDLWQDKKNPSRQAHKIEKALEKEKEQGVKMAHSIEEVRSPLNTRIITYGGPINEFRGKRFVVDFGDLEKQVAIMVFPELSSIQSGKVPSAIQSQLSDTITSDPRYKGGTIIYSK